MKMTTLFLLTITLAAAPLVHAQTTDSARLQQAATGASFNVGNTQFRLVPNATAQRIESNASVQTSSSIQSQSRQQSVPTDSNVVGQVGPYAIVLQQDNQTHLKSQSAVSAGSAAQSGTMGVAVNLNSGQAVLVPPRLKVFVQTADVIDQVANATGGTTVQASSAAGMGVIRYSSVEAAQTALDKVKETQGVNDASLDIIQGFIQKQ
ncbi:hypothetical protein GCM10009425_30420 [Pseudomonas asuensis]|uniref:Uncharacterized protein n=1 Tax=Pseudomonas asuensis TaxID=1825787 RepID=A0ABQ2GYK5_9PSED|nr:hypothetical protein [Pseudomonas asuensis]GGM17340.1 hypothetical protein GCM10009425_30420 [Pseudomonas asuensis]